MYKVDLSTLKLHKHFKEKLVDTLELIDSHSNEMHLESVWLFGSCTRGTPNALIDLDILLVTNADTEREVRVMAIKYDIDTDYTEPPVQITVRKYSRTIEDYDNGNNGEFMTEVNKDKILLRRY